MPKRIGMLSAKPGQLRVGWARPDRGEPPDICYAWGAGGADKSDARILSSAIEELPVFDGRSLREELILRGYDITTLKISIETIKE